MISEVTDSFSSTDMSKSELEFFVQSSISLMGTITQFTNFYDNSKVGKIQRVQTVLLKLAQDSPPL